MKQTIVACIVITGLAALCPAGNWPNWRGPTGNGVAEAGQYPVEFSADSGLLWKVRLPGKGSSTPVVWGDDIFITCGIGQGEAGQDGVLCFDWTGKQKWQVKLGPQRKGKHKNGSGSNPSVITDGERIVAYFKSGTVAGLGFDGKVLWKRNLQREYGKDTLWWDLGTSPVLADGKAVIAVMQAGESYVVAIDIATGKNAWKVDRTFKRPIESDQAYTTPIVMKDGGKTTVLIWGADYLTGHDAATGKTVWRCGGFNPTEKAMWRVIASAVVSDGVAVVPYGRGNFLAAVSLVGKGDVTKTAHLWGTKGLGSDVPTAAATGGKLYHLSDRGKVTCMNIQTGKKLWQSDLPGPGGRSGKFYSSPTLAGNRLYMFRETGAGYVCEITSSGLKVLARPNMGDRVIATPVCINNKVLIRGEKYLYCAGK